MVWGLAPYQSINYPARLLIDLLDWPLGQAADPLDQNTRWLSAIGAGLLGGLAVLIGGIVAPAARRGDTATCRTTIAALSVWLIIDSAGSVVTAHTANAVFNVITFIILAGPLIGTPGILRPTATADRDAISG